MGWDRWGELSRAVDGYGLADACLLRNRKTAQEPIQDRTGYCEEQGCDKGQEEVRWEISAGGGGGLAGGAGAVGLPWPHNNKADTGSSRNRWMGCCVPGFLLPTLSVWGHRVEIYIHTVASRIFGTYCAFASSREYVVLRLREGAIPHPDHGNEGQILRNQHWCVGQETTLLRISQLCLYGKSNYTLSIFQRIYARLSSQLSHFTSSSIPRYRVIQPISSHPAYLLLHFPFLPV